jgi:hypothetical protein
MVLGRYAKKPFWEEVPTTIFWKVLKCLEIPSEVLYRNAKWVKISVQRYLNL